jgi:hypothetical protein
MKIIVTTSDNYHHIIPVFSYLFNKHWGGDVELVGYKEPENLPDNFKFTSLGTQGSVNEWSTDLRQYFETQPDWFIWMMEDSFIKSVNKEALNFCYALTIPSIGRIGLTKDIQTREHTQTMDGLVWAHPKSKYRQSTQPSIWNKEFLLHYLKDGMTPWEFETQPTEDLWNIVGLKEYPLVHNEGVRKQDITKLNLEGLNPDDLQWIESNYI